MTPIMHWECFIHQLFWRRSGFFTQWAKSGIPDLYQFSKQVQTVVTFEPGTLNLELISLDWRID
jgi:hypothetical protein